jgi:Xaa-Pro aminopeptidase
MIITIEPGIYLRNKGVGARIEDDILVDGTGSINLSKSAEYK